MAMRQLTIMDRRSKSKKAEDERYDELRCRFMRIYPNLPLCERTMPIIVLDVDGSREPLSWKVCRHHVENRTGLGKRILYWLGKMEFI